MKPTTLGLPGNHLSQLCPMKEESVDVLTMPHDELIAAQQEDPAIARVFRPTYQQKQQESAIALQLLHE